MGRTLFWESCGFPAYGPNAVTWPLVYDESVSIVQQIAYIMGAVNELKTEQQSWATLDDLQNLLDAINADQEQQTAALKAYADGQDEKLWTRVIAYIGELEKSMMVWDVTRGEYASSVEAMRNLYNWLAVHAVTVEQLAEAVATVDDLAAQSLNVRGLATWSTELVEGWTEPAGIRVDEEA